MSFIRQKNEKKIVINESLYLWPMNTSRLWLMKRNKSVRRIAHVYQIVRLNCVFYKVHFNEKSLLSCNFCVFYFLFHFIFFCLFNSNNDHDNTKPSCTVFLIRVYQNSWGNICLKVKIYRWRSEKIITTNHRRHYHHHHH